MCVCVCVRVCTCVREKVCSTALAVIFSILNSAHEGWCVWRGGREMYVHVCACAVIFSILNAVCAREKGCVSVLAWLCARLCVLFACACVGERVRECMKFIGHFPQK